MIIKTAAPLAPSLKEIVKPILPRLAQVEDRLNAVALESEGILAEASCYVLEGGGKRLRAALVLYCASLNGPSEEVYDNAARVACAVELIHSATLVHDDIIDHAVIRRLKPTVHIRFGGDVAVLLGDFLYARAFEMIAQVGNASVTELMARTTRLMCEGELDQLKHRFRADLALPEYLSFIERKTAALIAASAESGAALAGLPLPEQKALSGYGMNLGIAFQIVDDILDIAGQEQKTGKTLHTDMGSGKMTLPLILLRATLEGEEQTGFVERQRSPNADWKTDAELAGRHNIIEKSEAFAHDYLSAAESVTQIFSPAVRRTLSAISDFVVRREY